MHTYILGQSGTGKTTLLKQYILDSISAGCGVFYFDPHGHDTDELLQYIPRSRRADVILFDPSREEILGINPLHDTSNIPRSAAILADTIKEAWGYADMPTPTMDMVLFFSLALLAENRMTLADLPALLTDKSYRERLTSQDAVVQSFWVNFETMTGKEQRDMVGSTLNKALLLIADPKVRRSLQQSSFSLAEVVDGKILFARLPQGQLSKGRSSLLGSVLLSLIHQACLARNTAVPFHIYLDECHLLAPSVVKELLSGIRKFNVEVTLAHQYIDQLDDDYFAAITGNCGDMAIFRTSMDDAQRLERRFGPNQMSIEFDQLPDFTARKFPFSAATEKLKVAPIEARPYPRSLPDILENHRRNLWRG